MSRPGRLRQTRDAAPSLSDDVSLPAPNSPPVAGVGAAPVAGAVVFELNNPPDGAGAAVDGASHSFEPK